MADAAQFLEVLVTVAITAEGCDLQCRSWRLNDSIGHSATPDRGMVLILVLVVPPRRRARDRNTTILFAAASASALGNQVGFLP